MNVDGMFSAVKGWTTRFEVNGKFYGGHLDLSHDPRVPWQLEVLGGVKGNRILELGPLEGAHTKMLLESGAKEIVAVEGNPNCWMRCLIVQQVFELYSARFLLEDFCEYVSHYCGPPFDVVSSSGVLYHQTNPALLIYHLSRITDRVMVWSQVANASSPGSPETSVEAYGKSYRGKINNYGNARVMLDTYCGGLWDNAFWMYGDSMRQCFKDAGFSNIVEKGQAPNEHGDCLLFVAMK